MDMRDGWKSLLGRCYRPTRLLLGLCRVPSEARCVERLGPLRDLPAERERWGARAGRLIATPRPHHVLLATSGPLERSSLERRGSLLRRGGIGIGGGMGGGIASAGLSCARMGYNARVSIHAGRSATGSHSVCVCRPKVSSSRAEHAPHRRWARLSSR